MTNIPAHTSPGWERSLGAESDTSYFFLLLKTLPPFAGEHHVRLDKAGAEKLRDELDLFLCGEISLRERIEELAKELERLKTEGVEKKQKKEKKVAPLLFQNDPVRQSIYENAIDAGYKEDEAKTMAERFDGSQ